MKLLVLIGSLREASFTRKLAKAVVAAIPEGIEATATDAGELPLYNQDLDGDEKPAAVQTLLDQVSDADGLIFVSPEFNYGIPGPLKNAIDWASRPAYRSPLKDKPTAVITCSLAPTGGARAHTQLSSVLTGTLTPLYNAPAFSVGAIHEKFDESGALTDEMTSGRLAKTLAGFVAWAESLKS